MQTVSRSCRRSAARVLFLWPGAGEKNALQEAIVGAVTAGPPELQAQVGAGLGCELVAGFRGCCPGVG